MTVNINKDELKRIKKVRDEITIKITELDKSSKTKSETELKQLIKLCKEFEKYTIQLQELGQNARIWHKRLDYRNWDKELKNKTSIKSLKKPDQIIKNIEEPLYYIMLCWTNKNDYFVCGSVIDRIKTYFEKLKLEFFDTQTTTFPDRTEHCSTFKFRGSEDVYNTIISSAEYIIDISASTIIENCNVGVFGKRIE